MGTELSKLKDQLVRDPRPAVFMALAEAYRASGNLGAAIETLVVGKRRHPGYVSGRAMLGQIYLQTGMFREARVEFEDVTRLNDQHVLSYKKLSFIYQQGGEHQKSKIALDRVLAIDPYDKEVKELLISLEGVLEKQRIRTQKVTRLKMALAHIRQHKR